MPRIFNRYGLFTGLLASLCFIPVVWAEYPSVIGEEQVIVARYEHTFADLAEANSLGFNEMLLANPDADPWLPTPGTLIRIPGRHIVPETTRQGVVINLSEYRMYVFRTDGKSVASFPIGIGTLEFPTPIIDTEIVVKMKDPAWYPPPSIRERQLNERGDVMPRVIPPGPDNPLGPYAIKLGAQGYLIHGTNKGMGVGMAVSHGCIRMYNKEISSLIYSLPVGTPVKIIRQPVKVAVVGGEVLAEVHWDDQVSQGTLLDSLATRIEKLSQRFPGLIIEPTRVQQLMRVRDGRPTAIGRIGTQVALAERRVETSEYW